MFNAFLMKQITLILFQIKIKYYENIIKENISFSSQGKNGGQYCLPLIKNEP
jgi:hypothetical protein